MVSSKAKENIFSKTEATTKADGETEKWTEKAFFTNLTEKYSMMDNGEKMNLMAGGFYMQIIIKKIHLYGELIKESFTKEKCQVEEK